MGDVKRLIAGNAGMKSYLGETDLREVESVYVEIIRNLIDGERINILINDENYQHKIITLINQSKIDIDSIHFYKIKFIGIDYVPYGFDDYCCGYLEDLSEGG